MQFPKWTQLLLLAAAVLGLPANSTAADRSSAARPSLEIQHPMLQDPLFEYQRAPKQHRTTAIRLWIQALERDESELQRLAADTITIARRDGMPELEATIEPLMTLLARPAIAPDVARAAAQALIVLDARGAQHLLAARAAENNELAQLVEPALAAWGHSETAAAWLARLTDPYVPSSSRLIAIKGVADLGRSEAIEPLRGLAMDRRAPPHVRLAAARSWGHLQPAGLVATAQELSRGTMVERLLAVAVLGAHTDSHAIALLQQLAADTSGAVSAAAAERLVEIDPQHVFELADALLGHADVNPRRIAVRALATRRNAQTIEQLGPRLGDVNPELRNEVAARLWDLAQDESLRPLVIETADRVLGADDWRGIEQATLLLTQLRYEPAAERYIELLDHARSEVTVTAAWALGQLGLPETMPPLLEAAQRAHAKLAKSAEPPAVADGLVAFTAQAFQSMGLLRFQPAEPLLLEYVPKSDTFTPTARGAAVWALGWLKAGEAPHELSQQLVQRLSDVDSEIPEEDFVRRMCAVALGRMKSEAALPALRRFSDEGVNSSTGFSCYWAIQQITGEAIPQLQHHPFSPMNWFLVPLDKQG